MIVLKECVGKRKSHQGTVSPYPDKARLVGADGDIASFLTKVSRRSVKFVVK